ncbi:MAG: AI-2E family transporter [Bacteroidota bacterium]|nr:AI-2E family transporter [Bacteroidota bacterium]MDP4226259.1 AI-2E family transporter [Bacteroidota bacterium]MDP4273772.1 AI-2E family transporter [Bacteroidota bacterium]
MKNYPFPVKVTFYLLSLILFLYSIIVAKRFLSPIILGMLFAYMLFPLSNFLEKNHFPRIIAILISIFLLINLLFWVGLLIYKRMEHFANTFPLFKAQALKNIDDIEALLAEKFNISEFHLIEFIRAQIKGLFASGNTFMTRLISAASSTLFTIGILPVYIFLFLYYRTKLANFFLKLIPSHKKRIAIKILKEISMVATHYMGGISIVVAIICMMNTTGLYLLGIKYPFMLGALAACFTFIPYFGTLIGSLIPISFTLLTSTPIDAFRVLLLFIFNHFIENNLLTPNIVGSNLELSPLVIIIGIIAGGMVWGITGMFAIVPIMAMLSIICKYQKNLQPYYFLLGVTGTRRHALTIENIKNFWNKVKSKFFSNSKQ